MVNLVDQQGVMQSFSKAAKTYNDAAFLQIEIGNRLLEKLDYLNFQPKTILDLGCGTGNTIKPLQEKYPQATIIGLDIASGMLKTATAIRKPNKNIFFCQANAEKIPLQANSIDLIFSNCTLQWLPSSTKFFVHLHHLLSSSGYLFFSTFGPDTLKELKLSWQQVDKLPHVHEFTDMHMIGDTMQQAHFLDPVLNRENITVNYPDPLKLMEDLKLSGAHNNNPKRSKYLYTPKNLSTVLNYYRNNFATKDHCYSANYEIIYGHACSNVQHILTSIKTTASY